MTKLILFLTLYVLPAFIVWKSVNWLHTHVYKYRDPNIIDVMLMLTPGINIAAAIVYFGEALSNSNIIRKFFGLGDRE
jgi:hypothetical protein